jgi:hypothetical protein
MGFQPLINYAGYEHVLNAAPCFVHPINGTLYGCAIEKRGGIQQDLSIYRVRRGATERELVKRYFGGKDADSQFAMGGCALLQDGTLEVWASLDPIGSKVTKSGFEGMWDRIPSVDDPWTSGGAQGPPGPPGPAGAGGIVLFSTPLIAPAWEQRTLAGGLWVDIAATFGAPPASAYLVRFVASAAVANVRVRAGTEQAPFFLTLNTQIPGLEMHTQGWVPGPRAFISVVSGPAQVWLQVLGMGI